MLAHAFDVCEYTIYFTLLYITLLELTDSEILPLGNVAK